MRKRAKRIWRNDFRKIHDKFIETWYDTEFDKDIIAQSIAKQYHILPSEQEQLHYSDWYQLVAGLMPDTPLGRVVSIRSETDDEIIKSFGEFEKRVRLKWNAFRSSKLQIETTDEDKLVIAEHFNKMFAKMFK